MEIFLVFFSFSVFLVPVVLLIVYIVKTHALERRIATLEKQLAGTDVGTIPQREPAIASPPTPSSTTLQQKPIEPTPSVSATAQQEALKIPASKRPEVPHQEWELVVGTTWLNRIGAFALILAVGFFLKYAVDKDWINETVRVLIGAAAGGLCLYLAARTRKKGYVIFAQGLVGAGVSILYLSVYASFTLYHLVPQWAALLMMSAVTVLGLAQAFSYNSLAVSLLSWAGGFLTPILLSTGQSNEVALFTYLAVLSLGLLAVAVRKESWAALEVLTLGALYIMYFAWFDRYYTVEKFGITLFFLILFFLLFYGLDLVRMKLPAKEYAALRHTVQVLNTTLFYIGFYILLQDVHRNSTLAAWTLIFGVIFASTALLAKRYAELEQATEFRYGVAAFAFAALAAAIQFGDYATIRLWALEALGILWLASRNRWRHFLMPGMILCAATVLYLLSAPGSLWFQPPGEFALLFSNRTTTYGVVIASLGGGAYVLNASFVSGKEKVIAGLGIGVIMVLFTFLTVESNDYYRHLIAQLPDGEGASALDEQILDLNNLRQLTTSTIWLVYSILILIVGIWKNFRSVRFVAMGLFALSILKIFLFDLSFLETLYRIFSFLALGLILLAVSLLYQRYRAVLFPKEETGSTS